MITSHVRWLSRCTWDLLLQFICHSPPAVW